MGYSCASSVNQLAAGRVTAQPAKTEKTTGFIAVYPSRYSADQLLNHKKNRVTDRLFSQHARVFKPCPSEMSESFVRNSLRAGKGLQTSLSTAENQRVNIMRTFIGINGFKIHHVTDDVVFVRDAVTTVHIACMTRYV